MKYIFDCASCETVFFGPRQHKECPRCSKNKQAAMKLPVKLPKGDSVSTPKRPRKKKL